MGTFQVVYDDFSGGQYMGPKATNQPKNTWKGNDIIVNATGELIPVGTQLVGESSVTDQTVVDHWADGNFGYVFVYNSTGNPRLLRYPHTDGTTFPVSLTSYNLPQTPVGSVAFSSITGLFYWGYAATASSSNFYSTSNTGTSTLMSGTVDRAINGIVSYKLRLLAWGAQRLFYTGAWSGTAFGSWATNQYYEFDSTILAVYPRTDDVLVVCSQGVYSVTGVFGSGINIQMVLPDSNVSDGMSAGDVVNRSLYYVDNSGYNVKSGIDGRLYRITGASTSPVASFQFGDYDYNPNGQAVSESAKIRTMTNGRISVLFRTGWCYSESSPGVFSRSRIFTRTFTATNASFRQAKPGPQSPNEYILTAVGAQNASSKLAIYRTITSVPSPSFLNADFSTTPGNPTVLPVGTVELAEYWHQKPFTVKEMFVEYSVNTNGALQGYVQPTGVIDVSPTTLSSVSSNTITDNGQPTGGYRMYRYWPNTSSKGFGMQPVLTLTNCSVKRVIVNCED